MNKSIQKLKKLLPRILLIVGGIIIILAVLFGGIKANDFWQINKLVKASNNLEKQEKYQEAFNSLSLTQARWTTTKVRKVIEAKMVLEKQLIVDADNYAKANDFFGQSKWAEAKDSYSKVSDKFTHYKEAQDKIKDCQGKVDEANAQAEKDKQAEAQRKLNAKSSTSQTATAPTNTTRDCSTIDNSTPYGQYELFSCQMDNIPYNPNAEKTQPQQNSPKMSSCYWSGNNYICNYF